MRRPPILIALAWGAIVAAAPAPARAQLAAAPASARPVSLEDVRADFDKGEFRAAATKADKVLFAAGSVPRDAQRPDPQRYELLMLKGESLVHLHDKFGAVTAFKAAGKVAGDVQQLAAARANALVVQRSSGGKFTPRYGGGSGNGRIDIVPPESRKEAMAALRDELTAVNQPQIDAALRGEQLPAIERAFPAAADVYCLELFVGGGGYARADGSAGDAARELGRHAFELMTAEVSRCGARVDQLNQIANSSGGSARGWDTGRLGLTSQQRDELKGMLPYLSNIRDRAAEYRGVAARVGGAPQKWDALVADAQAAVIDAENLSNDR